MSDIITFLTGKKTYIVAFVAALLAAAQALGYVIPDYVYVLLSAAGLGSFRAAISTLNASVSAPAPAPADATAKTKK